MAATSLIDIEQPVALTPGRLSQIRGEYIDKFSGEYMYQCVITSTFERSPVVVLTEAEIRERFPSNGLKLLNKFRNGMDLLVVRHKRAKDETKQRSYVQCQLEDGLSILIPKSVFPADQCRIVGKQMNEWEVKRVLCQHKVTCNDFRALFYYVEWVADGTPAEWIHSDNLNFVPDAEAIPAWEPGISVVPAGDEPPLSGSKLTLLEAEWLVYSTYLLPDVQKNMQSGWVTSRGVSGRIRRGVLHFCSPAVKQRLLCCIGIAVVRAFGTMEHYTFFVPQSLPEVFTGSKQAGRSWWWHLKKQEDAGIEDLYIVLGDVTVHYNSKLHRMGLSFDYAVFRKTADLPGWTWIYGCTLPHSWHFLTVEQLVGFVNSKTQPYLSYLSQEQVEVESLSSVDLAQEQLDSD
jgi:hypothetical protein